VSVDLDAAVTALPGVGPALARKLAALELHTVRDLLEHYPRRYQDAGEVLDLSDVAEGEPATLLGEVVDWERRRIPPRGKRRAMDLTTATVRQASGARFTVTFFNQRWRPEQLPSGTIAAFSGKVKRFRRDLQLTSPDVQVLGRTGAGVDADDAAARLRHQRLLAVYPATGELTSFRIAELVETALDHLDELPDWLPGDLRDGHGLVDLDTAVRTIHRPEDPVTERTARRRLVFDELLTLQLGLQWRRARLEAATVGLVTPPVVDGLAQGLLDALPFAPTRAQQRAFTELGTDLAAVTPMHRLLQGDVGSGKTLVALWTMLCAVDNGRQAALMAPTEVLAEQHHRTLTELLAPLGVNVLDGVRVELLTSSTTATQRRRILGELLSGRVDLIVGTHALLEEGVRFDDLGVVVIDEQHRFGVSQRLQLKHKTADTAAGEPDVLPDVLVMTATPIPRSLALTLYGDLDVTVLDELPPGRQPIVTQLLGPREEERREKLYAFVRREAAAGRRTYVVCPLVEPSEALPATAAVEEHRRLRDEVFPDLTVELIHGRMRPDAKDAAMRRFRSGDAQVLVATTVIEVGVDVPEATVMVIEDAERFGISQLHQLRGRVGRGADRSYCVLFGGWRTPLSEDGERRLEAVAGTTDGFALADEDLAIRGEGALFGPQQSGTPELKLTRVQRDRELAGETRAIARRLIAADPDLEGDDVASLRAEVLRRFEGGWEAFSALQTG
jgi:ATP-dependent DNA helicase RecG